MAEHKNPNSYPKVIEIPALKPEGFSTRLEIIESHMDGEVLIIDKAKVLSFLYVGIDLSPTKVTEEK